MGSVFSKTRDVHEETGGTSTSSTVLNPIQNKQEGTEIAIESLTGPSLAQDDHSGGREAEEDPAASTQQTQHDETENDAAIAGILSEDSTSSSKSGEVQDSDDEQRHYTLRGSINSSGSEGDFERMIALAIVDSMDDETRQPDTATSLETGGTPHALSYAPLSSVTQPAICPICTHLMSCDPERGDQLDELPIRDFCPACVQVYHRTCLARWFNEDGEDTHTTICPTCRTEMDE